MGGLQRWKQCFVAQVQATFGAASENSMPKEQFAAHGLKEGPPTPDSRTWVQPLQNHFASSLLLGKKKKEKEKKERKKERKRRAQLDEAAQLNLVMEHLGLLLDLASEQTFNSQNLVKTNISTIAN